MYCGEVDSLGFISYVPFAQASAQDNTFPPKHIECQSRFPGSYCASLAQQPVATIAGVCKKRTATWCQHMSLAIILALTVNRCVRQI